MSTPESVIIVGAGQAGLQTALSLRQEGYAGALTLMGDEDFLPYHRPPLSKKVIVTDVATEQVEIRPRKVLEDAGIDLQLHKRVKLIDPRAKKITVAHGEMFKYDALVLATGVRARTLGLERRNLFTLRRFDQANAIRGQLANAQKIAIIGGGYIGLEAAAALRATGREVTIIELADRLLARVTSPQMSDYFARLHASHGVKLKLGARVEVFEGEDQISALHLTDGSRVPVDLVIAGIGNVTDTRLAGPLGMDTENGIMVDELCRTAVPGIFAVGDCTRFYSPLYGRAIRLESVQHAIDHGKAAALAILGRGKPYNPVPWFWSDQYDVKLQIAGLAQGFDEAIVNGDMTQPHFSVAYRAGGQLLAVDSINDARAHMTARRELGALPG